MCRFSALVYDDSVELCQKFDQHDDAMLQRCTDQPRLFENQESYNDGQAYFTYYNNTSGGKDGLLGFRGTDNMRDWLTDFNVIRTRMTLPRVTEAGQPYVHWGFVRQYRTLDDNINDCVRNMMEKEEVTTLHVTGHSLGGALAAISAVALKHEFPNLKIHCYTFGSPRPGDASFAKVFDSCVESSYRFLNNNDPVTASPTTWRFTHVGDGHWIYPDGMDTDNRTTDFKRFFKILYHGILSFMGRVTNSLSEFHSIQKYYDDIAEMWDGK